MEYIKRASVNVIEENSKNDRLQWLAGGDLREGTYAGGNLWSPTGASNVEVLRPKVSDEHMLMNGNILGYIGNPRTQIQDNLEGEQLGTIYEDDITSVTILTVTVDITTAEGVSVSRSSDVEVDSLGNITGAAVGGSLGAAVTALSNTELSAAEQLAGVLGSMLTSAPIGSSIGIAMYNAATGDIARAEQVVTQAIVSEVLSTFTAAVTKAAASALGLTSTIGLLGLTAAIGALFSEVFELAIGLDNSFGYGGNFLGFDENGDAQYSNSQSFGQGLSQAMSDAIGLTSGFSEISGGPSSLGGENTGDDMASYGFAAGPDVSIADTTSDLSDALGGYGSRVTSISELNDLSSISDYGEGSGGGFGVGSDSPGDQGQQGGGGRQGDSGGPDGSSGSESDSGGTYCCTAMNTAGKWKMVRTARMEKWHKTQPRWWRLGYDTWGKVVAKYVVKDGKGYGGTMINAFYDTKVKGKKATFDTFMSYGVIYSGVIVCGLFKLSTDKVASCYNNRK